MSLRDIYRFVVMTAITLWLPMASYKWVGSEEAWIKTVSSNSIQPKDQKEQDNSQVLRSKCCSSLGYFESC